MATQWDVDALIPGGVPGAAWAEALAARAAESAVVVAQLEALPPLDGASQVWRDALHALAAHEERLAHLGTIALCAWAVRADDPDVARQKGAVQELSLARDKAMAGVIDALVRAPESAIDELTGRPDAAHLAHWVRSLRSGGTLSLPPAQERVRRALEREAIYGWGELYETVAGGLTVRLPGSDAPTGIAAAQPLLGHPDEAVRRGAFEAMGAAWSSVAPVCAAALTNLTGARQQVADMLGVDELADTLDRNRVSRQAVDAMWAACDDVVPDLVRYLNKKASLLGKERLDAWDLSAPLPGADAAVPWDDAVRTITSSFDAFSPSLGAFARAAVAGRWIDGEPGPGRAQGGFCAFLPETGESRIFLTFGDARSVVTLAHELGHAWHNRWLAENPPGQRRLTSATAESASTFAETLYRDAASAAAASPDQKRRKLDEDLQAAVAYLMNIRGRFALERRLFELRREGALTPDTLRAETRRCFDHAYGGAVAHIDDMFWASKLHFYIPEFGFYNWPYTFGYLLSGALSARARAEGTAFEPVLARFLRATGWLDASEAAREALGADLSDPAFWASAMGLLRAKVDAFCAE